MIINFKPAVLPIAAVILTSASVMAQSPPDARLHRHTADTLEEQPAEARGRTVLDPLLGAPNEYEDDYSSIRGVADISRNLSDTNDRKRASKPRAWQPPVSSRHGAHAQSKNDGLAKNGDSVFEEDEENLTQDYGIIQADEEDGSQRSSAGFASHRASVAGERVSSLRSALQQVNSTPRSPAEIGNRNNDEQSAIDRAREIYRAPW